MTELGLFGQEIRDPLAAPTIAPTRTLDPETSRDAARVASAGAGVVAEWLLTWVRLMGKVTQDEATAAYLLEHPDVSPSTVRGRFKELETSGDLRRTGERMKNARGNFAQLWECAR